MDQYNRKPKYVKKVEAKRKISEAIERIGRAKGYQSSNSSFSSSFSVSSNNNSINLFKFPLAPMGVLAPVSAHAGPSAQPPIDTSGNFSARVSAESISPNFPIFRSK